MNKYLIFLMIIGSFSVCSFASENVGNSPGRFGKNFERYFTALYSEDLAVSTKRFGHANHLEALDFLKRNGFSAVQARCQLQEFAQGCRTAEGFRDNFKAFQAQYLEQRQQEERQRLAEERRVRAEALKRYNERDDQELSFMWGNGAFPSWGTSGNQ